MKAFNCLAITAALALAFVSCNKDDDKQKFTCLFGVDIVLPSDSVIMKDEVLLEGIKKEYETIRNAYSNALSAESDSAFTVAAKDAEALKTLLHGKCVKTEKDLGKVWHAEFKVKVIRKIDDKNTGVIYEKTFGQPSGANWIMDYIDEMFHSGSGLLVGSVLFSENGLVRLATSNYNPYLFTYDNYNSGIIYDLNTTISGSSFVYLWGHEVYNASDYITDVICLESTESKSKDFTLTYNGRKYVMSGRLSDSNGDLNQGAGGKYLYIMYTTDPVGNRKLVNIRVVPKLSDMYTAINEIKNGITHVTVPMVDEKGTMTSDAADMNKGCSGQYIYLECKYWDKN